MKITHEHLETAITAVELVQDHSRADGESQQLAHAVAALETIMNHLDKVNEVVEKAQI